MGARVPAADSPTSESGDTLSLAKGVGCDLDDLAAMAKRLDDDAIDRLVGEVAVGRPVLDAVGDEELVDATL